MALSILLKHLKSSIGTKQAAIHRRRKNRHTFPGSENLETRQLLAAFSWNTDSDGAWENPANWINSAGNTGVPGSADTVTIDRGAANPTVRISSNVNIASLVTTENVTLASGRLDASTTIDFNGGEFIWEAGLLDATTVTIGPQGRLRTRTASDKTFGRTMVSAGTVVLETPIRTTAASTTNFVNQASGVWTVETAFHTGNAVFVTNEGTFRKTTAANSIFGANDRFDHKAGSVIEVLGGKLGLAKSGTLTVPSTGATFDVGAGTVLDLAQGDAYLIGTFTGTGAGRIELSRGTIRADDGPGGTGLTFDFPEELFHWTGGTIRSDGVGGDEFTNSGFIMISGGGDVAVQGQSFHNAGTLRHSGTGSILFNSGGVGTHFHNDAGALYEHIGTGSIVGGQLFNSGTIRNESGNLELDTVVRMLDGSRLESSADRVLLSREAYFGTSTMAVTADSVVELNEPAGGGFFHVLDGATLTGTGAGRIEFTGGRLDSDNSGGTINFAPGQFHWISGSIFGGLTNTGEITIPAGGTPTTRASSVPFMNRGTVIQEPGSVIAIEDVLNEAGALWLLQNDARIVGANGLLNNDFRNAGILRKTGSGTSVIDTLGAVLSHQGGTVELLDGNLTASHHNSAQSTGGHFVVSAGSTFEIFGNLTSSGTYTGEGDGSLQLSARITGTNSFVTFDFPAGFARMTLEGAAHFNIRNTGHLTLANTEGWQGFGPVINEGTIIQQSGVDVLIENWSVARNYGVWELVDDATISLRTFDGLEAYFSNFGTLRKSGVGTAKILHGAGYNVAGGGTPHFNNAGTLEVLGGQLDIESKVIRQFDPVGQKLGGGNWYVGPFSTLKFHDAAGNAVPISTLLASVTLDGDASSFPNIGSLAVNGGRFEVTGGRNFTTAGGLTNGVTQVSADLLDVAPIAGGRFVGLAFRNGMRVTHPRNDRVNGDPVFYVQDVPGGPLRTIVQPGGPVTVSGIDITSSDLNVGGTIVPAGTLLFIHGNVAPPTLYAINPVSGQVIATQSLNSVGMNQSGVAHHPGRNSVYVLGNNATITEVNASNGSTISSFPVQPQGSPFFGVSAWGGIEIDSAGQLLVVGSSQARVRVLAPDGVFQTDVDLTFSGIARHTLSDISVDDTTGEIWLASENGLAFRYSSPVAGVQGTLHVGAGSTLNAASLASTPGSRVSVEVGGRPASGEFGTLAISGSASLSEVEALLVAGFGPTMGDTYNVITYGSRSGDDPAFVGLDPFFSADVSAERVTLTALASAFNILVDESSITVPAAASPGDEITISYTVRNSSTATLTGEWDDSIYLSTDGTFDPSDLLIGRVTHSGGLAALGSYTETLTARMPGVLDGDFQVIVLADSKRRIPDTNRADNMGVAGAAIASTVRTIALGDNFSDMITNEQGLFLKLEVPAGRGDVVVRTMLQQLHQADVFVRFNELPTRANFDFAAVQPLQLNRAITIPAARAGAWYILVQGREGASLPTGFQLSTERIEFAVNSMAPLRGSNLGEVTSVVSGSGFTPDTNVALLDGSGNVVALATNAQTTPNHVYATFDLTTLSAGTYDVRISDGDRTEVLAAAFEVVQGVAGFLRTTVTLPGTTRAGREYSAILEYTNSGDTDLVAPVITVAGNGDFRFPDVSQDFTRNIFFLATSQSGPAGVLAPGETVRVPFRFIGGNVQIDSFILSDDSADVMDWEELRTVIRPDNAEQIWNTAFDLKFSSAGTTEGDYTKILADAATRHHIATGNRTRQLPELIEFLIAEGVTELETTVTARLSLDEPGRPAAGVLLEATNTSTGETIPATSRADGLLHLPLPPGEYSLKFNGVLAPGALSLLTVPEGGLAEPLEWLVQTGAAIIGRAALEDRVLVPDPDNDVIPSVTAVNSEGQYFTATLGPGGRYEFRGLPDGTYVIQFETPTTVPARSTPILAIANQTVNVADLISIYGGSITGRTLDGDTGLPLSGITVVAEAPDGTSRSAVTDNDGIYLIDGMPSGLITVSGRSETSLIDVVENVAVAKGQTTTGIDLEINPGGFGSVSGTVMRGAAPVAAASVDVFQNGIMVVSAFTDADGRYELTRIAPGEYEVQVTAAAAVTLFDMVTVTVDETTLMNFQMQASSVLRGTVTQTGVNPVNPVRGLSLVLLTPSNESLLILTDENGGIGVEELTPGNYTLMLPDGSYRHDFTVGTTPETVTVNFEIAAGAILGRVRRNVRDGVAGVHVALIVEDQVVATTVSLSDGQYVFPFVSPGEYELRFSGEHIYYPPVSGVTVSAGSFVRVFADPDSSPLTVTLMEAATNTQTTSTFAMVIIPQDDLGFQMRTVLVENGRYSFGGLIPGWYRIIADDGERGYQWLIHVRRGLNSVQLTLEDLTEISGTLTDAAGAALPNALVVVTDSAGQFRWDTSTDENGGYSILLPPGQYQVTAAEPDSATTFSGVLPPTNLLVTTTDAMLNLQLTAGTFALDGQIVADTSAGSTPAGALVALLDENGVAVRTTEADFDGVFRFENLTAGTYRVAAEADGFHIASSVVNLTASDSVVVNATWHSPDVGLQLTRLDVANPMQGFAAATSDADDQGSVAAWIRNGVDGLRKRIEEALLVPEEQPRLVRTPRIPAGLCGSAADAARAAIQRALAMQRAADGFFDAWQTRYLAAQEILWANVGLFGINLLQFSVDLTIQSTKIKSLANSPEMKRFLTNFEPNNASIRNAQAFVSAETKSLKMLYEQAFVDDVILPQLQKTMQEITEALAQKSDFLDALQSSVGASTATAQSIVTELNGPTTLAGVKSAIRSFGEDPSLGGVSRVVGAVTGFAGRLGSHAVTLLALLPKLDEAIARMPPAAARSLQKLKDTLGPIANALNTISAASQGISDVLVDINDLENAKANYENALKRRDEALHEAERLIARASTTGNGSCTDPPPPRRKKRGGSGRSSLAGSFDPNDIVGPAGSGDEHFVRSEITFPYTIRFENIASATAPAQEVFITQQLSTDLDWTTFEIGSFGWGNQSFQVPAGQNVYETRIDEVSTLGFFVDVRIELDLTTGIATWAFTSTDPETGDLISEVFAGFLPPNVSSPEGEGFVEYSIRPKTTIADATRIDAEAEIVFDLNAPINTPVYSNTIDDTPPESAVAALPVTTHTEAFLVRWSGDDGNGSGIATFDIFVANNDGSFTLWLDDTTQTSATFSGQSGQTYRFYSVATDNVGFEQPSPLVAQATTKVMVMRPSITAPAATTQLMRPTIQWTSIDGVQDYDLWITNQSTGQQPVLRPIVAATSWVPTQDLGVGEFRIWVRGRYNDNTFTPWSQQSVFVINTQASFRPISATQTTGFPTIEWLSVPGAVRYDLWIDNLSTGQTQFLRNASLTSTSFVPQTELPLGRYRMWVRAVDAGNKFGIWSVGREFRVLTPPAVAGPGLSTFSQTPQFKWDPVPGAIRYDLWVNSLSGGGPQYIRNQNIVDTSFTPTTAMPIGNYMVWVRAVGPGGILGNYSAGRALNIGGKPSVMSPVGVTTDTTPVIRWTPVDSAVRYDLWINRVDVPQAQIVRRTSLTTADFETSELPHGTYRVWVRAYASYATAGDWSQPWSFSIDATAATAPTLLLPPVATFNTRPTFTWTALRGATHYLLYARNLANSQLVIQVPNITTTSFTPSTAMDTGFWSVWVRAYAGNDVLGEFSAQRDFGIGVAPVLSVSTSALPGRPSFAWTLVELAARYELLVNRLDVVNNGVINEASLTGHEFTPVTPLASGTYRAWIRAVSGSGVTTAYSAPVDFVVAEVNSDGEFRLVLLPGQGELRTLPHAIPASDSPVAAAHPVASETPEDRVPASAARMPEDLPKDTGNPRGESESEFESKLMDQVIELLMTT